MAKRKRTRKRAAGGRFVANAPKRRRHSARRRKVAVRHAILAVNPRRRRRHLRANPRRHARRRFHRNPALNVRGVTGMLMQGVQDGAAVYAGGLVARKAAGAISGMLPAGTLPASVSAVLPRLVASVGLGMLTPRFVPKFARMITAGAFSETIAATLALTPVAPYLGALPARRFVKSPGPARMISAWPGTGAARGARPVGVNAYPQVIGMPRNV